MSKKKRKRKTTCYACDRLATSRDHVPPKSFFLSSINGGPDQRINLITVPSCDKHNLEKSGDDQYILSVITIYIENNEFARKVFTSVITPTVHKRPWTVTTFYKDMHQVSIGNLSTGAFTVDRERFDKTATLISRGIYYHHYKKKSSGDVNILTYNLVEVKSNNSTSINQRLAEWRKFSTDIFAQEKKYGENQSSFYYQTITTPEEKILLRMVFYEGIVIDAYFLEK